MVSFQVVHAFCLLICFNRELFDYKLGIFGQIMRLVEVLAVLFYF